MDTHPSAVDTVTVYNLLSSPQRQHVLRILRHGEPPIDLRTLAARVTEQRDRDRPSFAKATSAGPPLATELHHVHLPKIADAGVIQYDSDAQVVVSFDGERLDSLLATGQEVVAALQRDSGEVGAPSPD